MNTIKMIVAYMPSGTQWKTLQLLLNHHILDHKSDSTFSSEDKLTVLCKNNRYGRHLMSGDRALPRKRAMNDINIIHRH